MPQSLTQIYIHLVFSTKSRQPRLTDDLREELHHRFVGLLRRRGCEPIELGSVTDHVHLLLRQPRTESLADIVRDIKVGTSLWLRDLTPELADFHWQTGYGAFSVSTSHLPVVRNCVALQAERHRTRSFKDEMRSLFRRHGIQWNERWVWE